MTDLINAQIKTEDFSLIETNTSNTFNSELLLTDFIGFPFNFRKNPELEDIKSKTNECNINFNFESEKDCKPDMLYSNSKMANFPKFSVHFHPKKRCRMNEDSNGNDNKCHRKYECDNIMRKVQVSYINFLTQFVNQILLI